MFLRSHCIIFVKFIVSVRINVFWRVTGHTVLSSLSLMLFRIIVSVRINVF